MCPELLPGAGIERVERVAAAIDNAIEDERRRDGGIDQLALEVPAFLAGYPINGLENGHSLYRKLGRVEGIIRWGEGAPIWKAEVAPFQRAITQVKRCHISTSQLQIHQERKRFIDRFSENSSIIWYKQ